MRISKIGEHALLDFIKKKAFSRDKSIIKGVGDDAAVLTYNKKKYMLLTTDTLVEDIHFKKKWFSPEQIGKKAVEQNVSDIAAMGGYPRYCLVSLQLPGSLDFSFFKELYAGIIKQCKKYRAKIIGGNVCASSKIAISLTLIGFVEKDRLCLRSSAKKDDLICVTGDLGKSAAGLELLKQGKKGISVEYFLNPKAKLSVARMLSKNNIRTMEDISDGLASEIISICRESKVGAAIYKNKIPINKKIWNDAKKIRKDPYELALYGGEEFELVFTVSKKMLRRIKGKKIPFSVIGEIVENKNGVHLISNGKKARLKPAYDHFRN